MKAEFANGKEFLLTFLFFVFMATMMLASLSSNTHVPAVYDFLNHISSIIQAKSALEQGQLFLRVAPTELASFHYPEFQFYSPTSFTFAGFIYKWISPSNPFIAYKISLWISLLIGGMYMYRLSFWFVSSKPAALLASIVYLSAPYYMVVINHLGGFNEALAMGLVPMVLFYTVQRYYFPKQNSTLLKTAIAWYLLITVHLITFVYTSIMVAILCLIMSINNRRFWNIIDVGIAYGFGCLLAAWYLGPSLLYGKHTYINRTFHKISDYPVSISDLFSPAVHIDDMAKDVILSMHPNIGLPILLGVGICIFALLNKKLLSNTKANAWLIPLLTTFGVTFFLVWSPINTWQWLPLSFSVAQYSWRLLTQVIWIGALLFAWAIYWLFNEKLDNRHVVIGTLLILASTSVWMPIPERGSFILNEFLKQPRNVLNENAYLIDVQHNAKMINNINSTSLNYLLVDSNLILDKAMPISPALLKSAYAPVIVIQGEISKEISQHYQTLSADINNAIISTQLIKPGHFKWRIPLTAIKHLLKNDKKINLTFCLHATSPKLTIPNPKIEIKQIDLMGFFKPSNIMTVKQVKPYCQMQDASSVCNVPVPTTTQVLELPIYYYPDMLRITLNGKEVNYFSILTGSILMTAIKPQAGQTNLITMEFRGLIWANILSEMGWGMLGLFTLYIFARRFTTETVPVLVTES